MKKKAKGGSQYVSIKYGRKHYLLNREKYIEKASKRRIGLKKKLKEYKKTLSCMDCGYNSCVEALDFDHTVPKFRNVSQMAINGFSWESILKEIEKCDVVCANCHRSRTYNRRIAKLV